MIFQLSCYYIILPKSFKEFKTYKNYKTYILDQNNNLNLENKLKNIYKFIF